MSLYVTQQFFARKSLCIKHFGTLFPEILVVGYLLRYNHYS